MLPRFAVEPVASTIVRTTLAILLAFVGVLIAVGGVFASLPLCTADGSCTAATPLAAVPGVVVGLLVVVVAVVGNRRY